MKSIPANKKIFPCPPMPRISETNISRGSSHFLVKPVEFPSNKIANITFKNYLLVEPQIPSNSIAENACTFADYTELCTTSDPRTREQNQFPVPVHQSRGDERNEGSFICALIRSFTTTASRQQEEPWISNREWGEEGRGAKWHEYLSRNPWTLCPATRDHKL